MIYNTEYALKEFEEHGELWIQQHLAGKLNTILDVGANIGEWTRMARTYNPDAEIHMFEIVPDTYRRLLQNIPIDHRIVPNGFGLSNQTGTVEMQYLSDADALSTQYRTLVLENSVIKTGLAFTGDEYVTSRELSYIDYLKVDVEGAEGLVLQGFKNTLESQRIGIIQFEYSYHAILGRWLLVDAYNMLRPLGYHLGRLTPNGVMFHDYTYRYETFNGPDYVAVHDSKMHLFR